MDSPTIQHVLNEFGTIPLADIQLLLSTNNIQSDTPYNTARNLLLTGNLR